jgi:hypothetical protein
MGCYKGSILPGQLGDDLVYGLVCDLHHLRIRTVLYRMPGVDRRGLEAERSRLGLRRADEHIGRDKNGRDPLIFQRF